ncbi:MAG: hypothetical protein AB2401_03150 [Bacillus sp. (in: firmicutes)]|jgi:hypothetical protein|uniref:Uncharacterized protein n=1 Tax=Mesobacillus jeotgali TaxID=129985 RepID=A0ABY9VJH1_9BACI|nr:hypothetical protein [Mesobacillus jeotgali]WNF21106.1 hypothetical protein RH061_12925 [Mesobacillus jeotgali]
MLTGIMMLAGLCLFEIILAKIALGSTEIKEFNYEEFFNGE